MRRDILMSIAEAKRLALIQDAIDGARTVSDVAALLGISERHVKRLKKGIREEGPAYLIHGNRGRTPANAITEDKKATILAMATGEYRDTSCEHMSELLEQHKNISISSKSITRILKNSRVPLRYSKKQPRRRKSRDRKPRRGMMLQCDASPFNWLEDRAPAMVLHGAIDDATGEIIALYFRPTEDLHGYMMMLKQVIENHGVPRSIYSDRHTIFFSPNKDKLSIEEELAGKKVPLTQFGTALSLFGITHIAARTAQAKGRVERLWETLQSRLVVEMRIAGIDTIEDANAFLPGFITRFTLRFAVQPREDKNDFEPAPDKQVVEAYLSYRDHRSASAGSTISYHGVTYQLVDSQGRVLMLRPRVRIQLLTNLDGITTATYGEQRYDLKALPESEKQLNKAPKIEKPNSEPHRPSHTHPWKQYQQKQKRQRTLIDRYVEKRPWHEVALGEWDS
jgi:transposase